MFLVIFDYIDNKMQNYKINISIYTPGQSKGELKNSGHISPAEIYKLYTVSNMHALYSLSSIYLKLVLLFDQI